ncbi:MAG: hypothetical protein DRP75_03975, partial [Candidatus Omnitrophota bacterium]
AIVRAISNQVRLIRIPVYQTEELARYRKVSEELLQELQRYPTLKEISKRMHISLRKAREIKDLSMSILSLDKFINEEEKGQLGDFLSSQASLDAPTSDLFSNTLSKDFLPPEFAEIENKERIVHLLELLPEREREVLCIRYGLLQGSAHTLEQTAKVFKISKERVRQVEKRAINRLKLFLEIEKEA